MWPYIKLYSINFYCFGTLTSFSFHNNLSKVLVEKILPFFHVSTNRDIFNCFCIEPTTIAASLTVFVVASPNVTPSVCHCPCSSRCPPYPPSARCWAAPCRPPPRTSATPWAPGSPAHAMGGGWPWAVSPLPRVSPGSPRPGHQHRRCSPSAWASS